MVPAVSQKKIVFVFHVINNFLTKPVRSRWSEFMDLDSFSVHKHANKELSQYPAILTLYLVDNPYILKTLILMSDRS